MKIVLVAGIYAPEIGGPATYAKRLKQELTARGHEVRVVAYANKVVDEDGVASVVRGNKLLNRYRYFSAVLPEVRKADIVYLLDWFAAGVPASLAAKIARKPYIVRVGGDYLWEQRYLERAKEAVSLITFYARGMHHRYPLLFWVIGRVLRGAACVVFNSDIQRELYEDHYGLSRTITIYNPVPSRLEHPTRMPAKKEFVYWGRLIVMKNVVSLIRAFLIAQIPGYTLRIIGDGPRTEEIAALIQASGKSDAISLEPSMPQSAVLESVKGSRAFVLPSWTDIAPNQVHEALAIGLPALVTEENYLPIRAQLPMTIDPHSIDDIAEKLRALADDAEYDRFAEAFRAIQFEHSWDDVVREHEELFKRIV